MEENRDIAGKKGAVWRQLLRLHITSPVLFYTLVALLVAEFAVVVVAPMVVPDHLYLYLYMGKEARESTKKFLRDGNEFLVCDEVTGWRTRPNSGHGKWLIDRHGARTTHDVGTEPARGRYVLFLGSSLTNGGTFVENDETISAYVEDASTESINFATMMYSLDQSYLAYRHKLGAYKADVVVVGLSAYPTAGLFNQYILFRFRDEHQMGCLKPRFELRPDGLVLIPPPPKRVYEKIFSSSELLAALEESDAYYGEFSAYKRLGFLPLSGTAYYVYRRARNFVRLVRWNDDGMDLLKELMDGIVEVAGEREAKVIFMVLPDVRSASPGGWRRLLPDHYGRMVAELKDEGYNLMDARLTLRESGIPVWDLYFADYQHYSSTGNRVIGEALREMIERLE
jgi:hypothetical protein